MNALELKLPPPVVALLMALAMWGISQAAGPADGPSALRWSLVGGLVCIGLAFDLAALLVFRRARTTMNPMRPQATKAIVRSGVYRLTRNPMYVGLVCFLLAWAAYLGSAWALIGALGFVAYIGRFQIEPEERVLAAAFGADYLAYKDQVRRWL